MGDALALPRDAPVEKKTGEGARHYPETFAERASGAPPHPSNKCSNGSVDDEPAL